LKPCKPIIIQNATENWQAHQAWDFVFFKKRYSNRQVNIDGKVYNFTEFIDLVLNGTNNNPAPYLREIKNIEDPDLDQFPLFAKAKLIKVLVREGESIFIPSGWWHTTNIITPSIAVLVNFINSDKWSNFLLMSLIGITEIIILLNGKYFELIC